MILVLEIKQINIKKPKFGLTSWFEGHYYIAEDREVKSKLDLLNIKIHKNFGLVRSQDNCIKINKIKNFTITRPAYMFETKENLIEYFNNNKLQSCISVDISCFYIVDRTKVTSINLIEPDYPELNNKLTL